MNWMSSEKLVERIRIESNLRGKRARASLLGVALGLTVTVVASPPLNPNSSAPDLASLTPASARSESSTPAKKHWFEIGKASWYGGVFNGKKTANGEHYDMTAWTCAHRTLPLGSWVKVTNLYNRKTIFLRVNDRGPVAESLIVDLSYAAARKLGISGLGKVKIEPVPANDPKLIDQMIASVKPIAPPRWPVAEGLIR
jgi:rare lipoprotein A